MNESDSSDMEGENKSGKANLWSPEVFLSMLLHELRNPVIVIKGYVGILASEEAKVQQAETLDNMSRYIGDIEIAIDSISEYLHELEKRNSDEQSNM